MFNGATLTFDNAKYNPIALSNLLGYRVIKNDSMVDKVQVKKHRKKRINKKYIKRYGYKHIPKKDVYVMGDMIIGHPATIATLDKLI